MTERRSHPSGRPIIHHQVKGRSIWRVPDRGPITPRLQDERKDLSLIGFHRQPVSDDFEDG